MAQQTQQEELAGALSEDVFGAGIAKPEEEKALEVMEAQPTVAGSAMQDNGEIGPATIIPEKTGGAWLVPATDEQGRMLTREETERRFAESTRSGRGQAYGLFEDIEQARTYRQAHMSHEGRVQMRAALAVAKGIPQERVARDKALAERLGVDPLTVHYAHDEAEERGIEKELEEYEGLQEYASRSQFHAAYVRGDMSQLKAIEDWDRKYKEARGKEQEALYAGGLDGEILAPNTSSAKTFGEAISKSKLQAEQSDLANQWIAKFESGDDAGAEELRRQIEAINVQMARNAAEVGPDESFLKTTKIVPAVAEQIFTSGPIQLKALASGAAAAGVVLGAGALTGPGVAGAVPLAGKAFTGATLAASSYGTFYLERNLALASMLTAEDAQGNRLPPDIALEAATLYGAVSAGLETISEKAFLGAFKKIEKTAAASAGRGVLTPWLRDVARTLEGDPALRATVRDALSKAGLIAGRVLPYAKRAGTVATAEGFVEGTQEAANVGAEVSAARLANERDGTKFNTAFNTPENRARIAESAAQGFWAGLGFGAGPTVVSGIYHGIRARSAAQYAQREQERHQVVEQAWTHANDPAALREVLETVAPETQQQVEIPLDRAVQLNQSGVDILTPLGISQEQAQDWAAKGLTVRASIAELHAFMNQDQFNAASQIFERHGEAATEIQVADEELARTLRQMSESGERVEAARAAELWMTPEERTDFGAEVDRLKSEMRKAAQASPNLSAQAEAVGGIDSVLDKVIAVSRRQASIEARRTGQKPADILRRKVVRTLEQAAEQANRSTEEAVEADIEAELSEPLAEATPEQRPAEAQAESVEQPVQAVQEGVEAVEAVETVEAQPAAQESPEQAEVVPAEEPVQAEVAEAPAVQETPSESEAAAAESRAKTDAQVAEALSARRITGDESTLIESHVEEPVVYEVWELGDLVPSHDPLSQFAKRDDYPQNVQERQYHANVMEQEKVRRNAAELQPRLLLTDNPDLANGPSVITRQGYVLGGNSRAMSLQVVYETMPKKAEMYRQALLKKASGFGIAPQAVEKLRQPVLVRVLKADMTTLEMAQASRRYNATKTQALTASDEGVSAAKDVSESTLKLFREAMKGYDTVAEYMQAAESRKFVDALVKDGVIRETDFSRLTDKDSGLLNEQGRSLVKNVLRGLVIDDADIVRNAPESVLAKIDRVAPVLVAIKARGGDWARAAGVFKSAVNQINNWMARGSDQAPHALKDISGAFSFQDLQDREQNKRSVQAVAMLLAVATEREMYARCATMDAEAENSAQRANAMSAILSPDDRPKSPAGAFVRSFFKPVAIVDGEVQRVFNPDKSETDAALMWASENSGPRHSVEAAREQLRKTALSRKVSPEEKTAAKERLEALKGKTGTVYTWGGPRERGVFGQAFRYRKDLGDVLWQSEPVPEDPLVALHNISEARLLDAAKLGGLPVPSLGITKADSQYEGFGDIYLIGSRDMVDPSTTPVFNRDAYTARFPNLEYGPVKSDKILAFRNQFKESFKDFESSKKLYDTENALYDAEQRMRLGKDPDNTAYGLSRTSSAKVAFLNQKGIDFEPVYVIYDKEAETGSMSPEIQALVKRRGWKSGNEITVDDIPEITEAYIKAISNGKYDDHIKRVFLRRIENHDNRLSLTEADRLIQAALDDPGKQGQQVYDKRATTDKLESAVKPMKEEYRAWIDSLVADKYGVPLVPVGRRRLPLTLENVVKAMTSKKVRNQEKTLGFGTGEMRAATAKQLKTLEDYNKFRDSIVDELVGSDEKDRLEGLVYDFKHSVSEGYDYRWNDSFEKSDEMSRALADAANKKGNTKKALAAALEKHDFVLRDEQKSETALNYGIQVIELLRNGLATYMEAKPQRAVNLNEFLGAVIPDNTSQEARKVLADNGIAVAEYRAGSTTNRQLKIDQLSRQLAEMQRAVVLFQRAWHGSPYKFDKFTLDHIGEGEGAQVHGWGLYFAQSRDIADRRYRRRLSDYTDIDKIYFAVDGNRLSQRANDFIKRIFDEDDVVAALEKGDATSFVDRLELEKSSLAFMAKRMAGQADALKAALEYAKNTAKITKEGFLSFANNETTKSKLSSIFDSAQRGAEGKNPDPRFNFEGDLKSALVFFTKGSIDFAERTHTDVVLYNELKDVDFSKLSIESSGEKGQLFEVEIPDNDVLLDEQKKFSEQPEKVQQAIEKLLLDHPEINYKDSDGYDRLFFIKEMDEFNGRGIYDLIANRLSYTVKGDYKKAASLLLKEYGVLGITYKGGIDGRCFVIWDEEAIQIYNTLYQAKLDAHQQELNQTPDAFARGAVTDADGNYFIDLFKRADLSTLFHELGHTHFLSMEKYVRDGIADAEMQADYEKLCKWLGAAPGEALTVEQHEQLARGWEAYLMEGKAPSEELRGVFQRICEWLLAIYRSVKALGVELNDEVRGVFDRMLATREEIEDAAARYELVDRTTGELHAMGMDPAQMAYTRRVLDAARQAAFVRLREKRDSDRKARLADYRRLAMNELRGEQVHQARSDMRKTPLDLESVKALMGDEMTARLQKKQPGTFKKEWGIDPGQFAMEHGYESAEAMLADMDSQPSLGKAVAARVDEMSKDYDQQYSAEEALFDSQELTEHASLIARQLAQITGQPYIQQQAVRQVAEQEMASRQMNEAMRVGTYRLNVRRALRDERRAVAQGKFAEALEANTKARINLEMSRLSQELRDGVDKSAKAVRRFVGSKSVAEVAKAFLAQLVRQHSFLGPDYAGGIVSKYSIEDLAAWQKKLEEDGYTMLIAPDVLATATVWRDMTVEQWQDFADAVRQVVTIERNQRKLLTAQGKKDLDEAVSEIVDSLKKHNKAKVNGRAVPDAVRALRRYHTAHMKVEQACIMLDGGKRGPLWHLLYEPINKAADEQAVELRKARDYLRDKLFGMYTKKEFRNLGKKVWIEAVGMSLTGEQILCIALNMGNKVNEERVKTGYGWDDAKLSSVLSRLTAKDWQFVQAVWDYLETFREPAFKVHEAVTGSRPRAVEAEARNVQTADGQTLRLRGGYYPIRYDPVENSTQFERDQKAMDQQLFGGRNYGAAQTKQGHLKERAEGGLGTPLLFDFTVLADHVFNVIHDITHRKAVLDVAKIIRNGKAKDAIETYAGREMYQELMPWLQDVANERQAPMSQIQRMAAWARSAGTIMQMGYKATTIAMVPFGYTQTIAEIGYGYGMLGYWHALKGLFYASTGQWKKHVAMREFVYSKSPFMRHRLENFDRDIRDFSKQINAGPISGWVDKARANAFLPMGYLQLWAVDMPSWWASYEKGLKENGGNEDDAAAYADSVVRRTQASGATKDLARVQRGSDLHKLLTMFYSYFNTLYNLGAQHIRALKEDHTPAGIWKAANAAILLWFLPSVLSEFAAGRTPEGDDDDEWLKWAAKIWIQVPFQACVFVRDIAGAVFSGFDYQLSPAQSAPASVAKFFTSMYKAIEKKDPSLAVKPTAEAIGYALRLPAKQPIITAQNMWEYCTDPRSEMYLRDIFFVKPKKRQKKQ